MCGIIAYLGRQNAVDILINSLKRLEYRGYDSAGLALLDNGLKVRKSEGPIVNLENTIGDEIESLRSSECGIAHTRWATHGPPTKNNAHPHLDESGKIALVHNGIIENYTVLKSQLEANGHTFSSDTDSEVLAHLIGSLYEGSLEEAVAAALKKVHGTFGIIAASEDEPEKLVAARYGSPLLIGSGTDETLIASDAAAIIQHTNQVIFLNDGDMAVISKGHIRLVDLDMSPVSRNVDSIDWDINSAEKQGYDHFMLKEIFEQDTSLHNAVRGRLDFQNGSAVLAGLNLPPKELARVKRILFCACGTSFNASLLGQYYIEDLATIPVNVCQAAEYRYRNPIVEYDTLAIALSQSGETADTLAAVKEAQMKGADVVSICNVVGSTIARETGRGVYLHAGPEISVASTKAFTSQVAVLLMLAVKLGRNRRLSQAQGMQIINELKGLPDLVRQVLKSAERIEEVAKKYSTFENMFFIGRDYLFPAALEGALKLKEISYIHAEAYHAAELKHGPIALLEENMPVVALACDKINDKKIMSNIQECLARKSPVLVLLQADQDSNAYQQCDILKIPDCSRFLSPILSVIVLQLFSYYVAKERGCEIDRPRNLAKSVTVE